MSVFWLQTNSSWITGWFSCGMPTVTRGVRHDPQGGSRDNHRGGWLHVRGHDQGHYPGGVSAVQVQARRSGQFILLLQPPFKSVVQVSSYSCYSFHWGPLFRSVHILPAVQVQARGLGQFRLSPQPQFRPLARVSSHQSPCLCRFPLGSVHIQSPCLCRFPLSAQSKFREAFDLRTEPLFEHIVNALFKLCKCAPRIHTKTIQKRPLQ